MKNLKQIKVIKDSLLKKKGSLLNEMKRLNALIKNKLATIEKIRNYKGDYLNPATFHISKSTAALNKNMELFIRKMDLAILQAENEIKMMEKSRSICRARIIELEKKVELMDLFQNRINKKNRLTADHLEQADIDDLVATSVKLHL